MIPSEEETSHKESPFKKPTPLKQRFSKRTLNSFRVLVLAAIAILTIVLIVNREKIAELEAWGYPGIFLISILVNATILIPVPGVMFTSAMGAVFNPFWVAIAAGLGAAIGELFGYLAGYSGQAIVEKGERYERVSRWMEKNGDLSILFLSFVPNPLFDLAGIIAGALKMPLSKFFFYCMIGKILKMMTFAYAGGWLINLWQGIF